MIEKITHSVTYIKSMLTISRLIKSRKFEASKLACQPPTRVHLREVFPILFSHSHNIYLTKTNQSLIINDGCLLQLSQIYIQLVIIFQTVKCLMAVCTLKLEKNIRV